MTHHFRAEERPADEEVSYDVLVSKETYYSVKRDLLQCQKRPTISVPRSDQQTKKWATMY
jgi:hypothetical protein